MLIIQYLSLSKLLAFVQTDNNIAAKQNICLTLSKSPTTQCHLQGHMYKSSKHAISRDHSELEETGQDVIFWVNGCYDDYYRGLGNDQNSD